MGSSTSWWHTGNALDDGAAGDNRGWLIGHHIPLDMPGAAVRRRDDLEVKWAQHAAGERRPMSAPDPRTTLTVLISGGVFVVDLPAGEMVLSRPGDYVLWGAGMAHAWHAVDDAVMLTVRWPSRPSGRRGEGIA